jgi:hypothetical protein
MSSKPPNFFQRLRKGINSIVDHETANFLSTEIPESWDWLIPFFNILCFYGVPSVPVMTYCFKVLPPSSSEASVIWTLFCGMSIFAQFFMATCFVLWNSRHTQETDRRLELYAKVMDDVDGFLVADPEHLIVEEDLDLELRDGVLIN